MKTATPKQKAGRYNEINRNHIHSKNYGQPCDINSGKITGDDFCINECERCLTFNSSFKNVRCYAGKVEEVRL